MTSYNWYRKKVWSFYTFPNAPNKPSSKRNQELVSEQIRAERYLIGDALRDGPLLENVTLETIDTSQRPNLT